MSIEYGLGRSEGREIVRMSAVSKTFANGTVALSGLDLAVREHEFVGVVGPSGCGKSTALRLIAGLATASAGAVAKTRRPIGFVFQEPTLMPWATVFDNVRLPLGLAGRPAADSRAKIDETLAMVGLDGFSGAYPRELSGGMKMRVSIARALVTEPSLLLLDEPFAALDEITRMRLNDDLLALWRAQRWTVVFVTHSVFESVYLSSRVLVMTARPGRIVAEIAIPRPYPRDTGFRMSEDYNGYCRAVSARLSEAMSDDGS